mmetsp:Transcript_20677/g.45008  ORF Transcript_20677/g.45008 Transcript_20677/m.45008 type:complete len:288 (-) Transcript_20677:1084-1947(-)
MSSSVRPSFVESLGVRLASIACAKHEIHMPSSGLIFSPTRSHIRISFSDIPKTFPFSHNSRTSSHAPDLKPGILMKDNRFFFNRLLTTNGSLSRIAYRIAEFITWRCTVSMLIDLIKISSISFSVSSSFGSDVSFPRAVMRRRIKSMSNVPLFHALSTSARADMENDTGGANNKLSVILSGLSKMGISRSTPLNGPGEVACTNTHSSIGANTSQGECSSPNSTTALEPYLQRMAVARPRRITFLTFRSNLSSSRGMVGKRNREGWTFLSSLTNCPIFSMYKDVLSRS